MKMKKQGGGRNEYTNFELFHLAAAAGSGSTASRQHKRRGRKKYGLEAAAGRAAVTRCVFHNHGRCWRRWWQQQQHRSCQIYGLGTHLNQFSSSNVWSLNIAPGPSQFFSSLHSPDVMWLREGAAGIKSLQPEAISPGRRKRTSLVHMKSSSIFIIVTCLCGGGDDIYYTLRRQDIFFVRKCCSIFFTSIGSNMYYCM